jgi:hypothetical protein
MSDTVVCFAAARTARMLRQNAPPQAIDRFVARMALIAREQSDAGREDFWREVARLAGRGAALAATSGNSSAVRSSAPA